MSIKHYIYGVSLSLCLFVANTYAETNNKPVTNNIYYGGDIITMEGEQLNYAEAVVTHQDKIVYVGDKEKALTYANDTSKVIDLKGKTMMPGFVEPHVHPLVASIMLPNEIIAPYDWVLPNTVKKGVQGHDAYLKAVTKSVNENANKDEVYFIWGYHQLWHGELNRDMLNNISKDKPIAIIHRSFHEIFLNDAAISKLGIKKSDFANNPQVYWEKGHFYEGGWFALVPMMASELLAPKKYLQGLAMMSELVEKNGITTIAEPGFPSSSFDTEYTLLKQEMDTKPPFDIFLIPNGTQLYGMKGSNENALTFINSLPEKYNTSNIQFLPKQVKLFADGAIYSQLMQMKDGYIDGHKGEWITPLALLQQQLDFYWDRDFKIHAHTNGDLGIQEVMGFVSKAQERTPKKEHRFTMHHMGYFDDTQAQQVADLQIDASVNPYYLWALADKYAEHGLGKERGENLVRMKSLTDRGVHLSFHSDFSMAPMEPLTLAWTAVNRITSQGSKFSQAQRLDMYTAMKAITIDAARVLSQEHKIGSIKKGKTANFTILAENPFKVEPIALKDIDIITTVFRGTLSKPLH